MIKKNKKAKTEGIIDELKSEYTMYDNECYIGKVQELDDEDAKITFMKTSGKGLYIAFAWPKNEDEVWVPLGNISCVVKEPEKNKRFFND